MLVVYIFILDNPLEDKGAIILFDSLTSKNSPKLQYFYLKCIFNNIIGIKMTDLACLHFSELLLTQSLNNIIELDLSCIYINKIVNNLSNRGIFAISQKWKLNECNVNKIEHLNLSVTSIENNGLKYINDMFLYGKFDNMKQIDFTCNRITDSGIWHMSEIYLQSHPKSLEIFNFSCIKLYNIVNYLKENSISYIEETLQKSPLNLKELNLSCIIIIFIDNDINPSGIRVLGKCIMDSLLKNIEILNLICIY